MPHIRMKTSLKEGSFILKSLDDFDMPGFELADAAFYSETDKRAQLIRFVFEKAGIRPAGEALTDMLETMESGKADEAEIREALEQFGQELDGVGSGCYFGGGSHADYTAEAERAVRGVRADYRLQAYAHVLVYCWMFRRPFGAFSESERRELLTRWNVQHEAEKAVRGADEQDKAERSAWGADIVVGLGKREFTLAWSGVGNQPLTVRRVVNPLMKKAALTLHTPMGERTVWLPADGRLNAYFAGEKMVCIKGSVQMRKNAALSGAREQKLQRLEKRMEKWRSSSVDIRGQAVQDFAMARYNQLYLLRDGVLYLPDGQTVPDVIGVFSSDDLWVAWKKDGSTQSNDPQYCEKNVLAVVDMPEGICLVQRRTARAQADAMACMLERFETGKDHVVERVCRGALTAQLDGDGRLTMEEWT